MIKKSLQNDDEIQMIESNFVKSSHIQTKYIEFIVSLETAAITYRLEFY